MLEKQIEELIKDEKDLIANLSNISALIMDQIKDLNWVGFYRLIGDELLLGPFQGKVACVHLKLNKGVVGTSVYLNKTLVVDDVHTFSGHIACDSNSNSEVVIPIHRDDGSIYGALDIDSPLLNRFNKDLVTMLEMVVKKIEDNLRRYKNG